MTKHLSTQKNKALNATAENAVPSELARQIAASLDSTRRYKKRKPLRVLKNMVLTVLGKRTREDAALDFAQNHRHKSKRERRRKRIAICMSCGLVAASLAVAFFTYVNGPNGHNDLAASVVRGIYTEPSALPESGDRLSVPTVEKTAAATEDTALPTQTQASKPTPTPLPTTKPEPTPPPVTLEECIDDFVVQTDIYYGDLGFSTNYYEYTEEEKYMLAQIIDIEAGGEPYEGMIAVGNVVLNRVLNRHQFPSTVKGVITSGAFAYAGREDRVPSYLSRRAARDVLDYQVWVIPQNVYYFRSDYEPGQAWRTHKYYKTIGGHNFYAQNYSGRNRNDEIPPPLFERVYKYPQYGCEPAARVKRVQQMLRALGFEVSADGYFGRDTDKALKLFQETHGLEADGVAGPATLKALLNEYGLENYYMDFLA